MINPTLPRALQASTTRAQILSGLQPQTPALADANGFPLMSPGLQQHLISDLTPLPAPDKIDPIEALVQNALPEDIVSAPTPDITTPSCETAPPTSLDAIVGAHIDPTATPLPTTASLSPAPSLKVASGLRLPSFEALGIANPRPDRRQQTAGNGARIPLQRLSDPLSAEITAGLSALNIDNPTQCEEFGNLGRSLHSDPDGRIPTHVQQRTHIFEVLTPPEDHNGVLWDALSNHPVDPSILAPRLPIARQLSRLTPNSEQGEVILSGISSPTPATPAAAPRIALQRTDSDAVRAGWLEKASSMLLSTLRATDQSITPIRVLSHALPCPSPSGFAHPYIINALNIDTPGSPLCWISVFHALPGRYMNEMPSSPPSTPGPPVGGDDYFTSKTFDSAVQILDYQDNVTTLPRTPMTAVPPSTIAISIIERYIPPTNSNEFADMFKPNSRSLVVDRMLELSPNNGSLLFIYPTKTGARTFARDYLGPLLDPLLRSMQTVHQLPMDLMSALGRMPAINSMLEFDALESNITQLCAEVPRENRLLQRFTGGRATYSLELATTCKITIERSVWAEKWWVKQEKTRLKDIITTYFRSGLRGSSQPELSPTGMLHAILDGVASRPYAPGEKPTTPIEIGLFVIKRTA